MTLGMTDVHVLYSSIIDFDQPKYSELPIIRDNEGGNVHEKSKT